MAILFIRFQCTNKLSEQLHGKLHIDSNWHFYEYILSLFCIHWGRHTISFYGLFICFSQHRVDAIVNSTLAINCLLQTLETVRNGFCTVSSENGRLV